MPRPHLARVPEWYHGYINQVKENDLREAFSNQNKSLKDFFQQIPTEKRKFRYGPDKWSIQDLLQHIIDAERIFGYRALCIARGDKNALPGFEENDYAAEAKADRREWNEMIDELMSLRNANSIMFNSFTNEELDRTGTASNKSVYVMAIGFIMVGHIAHHIKVIRERYLQ